MEGQLSMGPNMSSFNNATAHHDKKPAISYKWNEYEFHIFF